MKQPNIPIDKIKSMIIAAVNSEDWRTVHRASGIMIDLNGSLRNVHFLVKPPRSLKDLR
jgi:hypothetical protein